MVDLFEMEDKCDKHFKEGVYAPKKELKNENVKDDEEVVHIDEEGEAEEHAEPEENAENEEEEE